MNPIQISILGFAVALNSFMSYYTSGVSLNSTDFDQRLRTGFAIFLVQVVMLGSGLWLGIRVGILAENSNYYISLCILLFIGLKIIFESLRNLAEKDKSDLREMRELFIFSLSEGIISLLLGMSIGLAVDSLLQAWIILIVFQTIAIIIGFYLGSRKISFKLGFKLEIVAGLIILAAALKLLISLIGY
jgi:manganese efflux pump family protein